MKIQCCDINTFKPALNISFLIGLLRKSYLSLLRLKYPHLTVRVASGLETVKALQSNRVIICPNHPTAMDTDMAFLLATILKEELYFMTAREVFMGNVITKYLLQLFGCYSVLRGTNDFNSFRYSVRLLEAGSHKLVIFPEGEICRRNDTLLPIKTGTAHIACTAVDELNKSGLNDAVYIVPVAFRYSYSRATQKDLLATMSSIEKSLNLRSLESQSLEARMIVAAENVLQELLSKYSCLNSDSGSFSEKAATARTEILNKISSYSNFKSTGESDETELIHRLFVHLYKARWFEHQLADNLNKQSHNRRFDLLTEMIKDLFRVCCFISIGKPSPLRDRNDDINDLMLLRHEVLGDRRHLLPSCIQIAFGKPIDVRACYSGKKEEKLKSILNITDLIGVELKSILAESISAEPEVNTRLEAVVTA